MTTSIPRTPNNSRLLGYASRLDIDAKPVSKIPVIVYDFTYMRRGMMYLSSAYNTTKGYGVTIAFAEGVMYEEMKSVKLTALSGLPVIEKDYQQMKEYMDNLFIDDDLDSELTLFTITLKDEDVYKRQVLSFQLGDRPMGSSVLNDPGFERTVMQPVIPRWLNIQGYNVYARGDHNLQCEEQEYTIKRNRLHPRLIDKQVKFLYGLGPHGYFITTDAEGKLQRKWFRDPEVFSWLESWQKNEMCIRDRTGD